MKIVTNPGIGITAIALEDEEAAPILKLLGLKLKDEPKAEEKKDEGFTIKTDAEGRTEIDYRILHAGRMLTAKEWYVYGSVDGTKIFVTPLPKEDIDWDGEKVYYYKTIKNVDTRSLRMSLKFDNKRFKIGANETLKVEAIEDFLTIYTNREKKDAEEAARAKAEAERKAKAEAEAKAKKNPGFERITIVRTLIF